MSRSVSESHVGLSSLGYEQAACCRNPQAEYRFDTGRELDTIALCRSRGGEV